MKKGITCFTALALLLGSSYSFAEFYIGASVGQTNQEFSRGKGTSFGGVVGYKFNKYLAIEGGYSDYGNTQGRYLLGIHPSTSVDTFNVSAIAMFPISKRFNIYTRAGVHDWKSSTKLGHFVLANANGTDFGYGGGVNFNFTDTSGMFVEYRSLNIDGENTDNISVGMKIGYW